MIIYFVCMIYTTWRMISIDRFIRDPPTEEDREKVEELLADGDIPQSLWYTIMFLFIVFAPIFVIIDIFFFFKRLVSR